MGEGLVSGSVKKIQKKENDDALPSWIKHTPMKILRCRQQGSMDIWHECLLDDEDYERAAQHVWRVRVRPKDRGSVYFEARIYFKKERCYKKVTLHRFLMGFPKNATVDHKNRNTLDNQRSNLRLANRSEQSVNRKRYQTGLSSAYKGVRRTRALTGSYMAHIKVTRIQRNKIYLGTYKTEAEAAMAYDRAARKYFGEFAQLNFP